MQFQDKHSGVPYRERGRLMAFHGAVFPHRRFQWIVLVPFLLCFGGCLLDNKDKALGHGHDFGENDSNLVLCMGDSITVGGFSGGAPWPTRFGVMTGKAVINDGINGAQAPTGAARIQSNLRRHQPGFVIIFYGANDAIHGTDVDVTASNIRHMIHLAKVNQSIPLVANVMPMTGAREVFNARMDRINEAIDAAARDAGVKRINLHASVRKDPDSLLVDGLHLNELGEIWVAMEFMDVF